MPNGSPRTIRTSLPLAGISAQYLREFKHTVVFEDSNENEIAVLMPYDCYLEMQSLIIRADRLLPHAEDIG